MSNVNLAIKNQNQLATLIKKSSLTKGFTLIEVAIVLVIIGLLLGGVIKSQELIINANIKSMERDLINIGAADSAYYDRTGVIAGKTIPVVDDDPFAVNIGRISSTYDERFWRDLRKEGFINERNPFSVEGPRHALDGRFIASEEVNGVFNGTNRFLCATNIESRFAKGLDLKWDDGHANTGDFIAIEGDELPDESILDDYNSHNSLRSKVLFCKKL